MFEEDAGVRYQVSTRERNNQFVFWILYSSVMLETLRQRDDRNYGGGRQEGGANSQGMLTPPLFLLVSRSWCFNVASVSVTGSSGQSRCTERVRDVWTNSFSHRGKTLKKQKNWRQKPKSYSRNDLKYFPSKLKVEYDKWTINCFLCCWQSCFHRRLKDVSQSLVYSYIIAGGDRHAKATITYEMLGYFK